LRFFFAAGKTGVDGAIQQRLIHLHGRHLAADQIEEIHGVQLRLAGALAHRIQRGLEEIHVADAGDLNRILERQKDARLRALFRVELQQVFAVVGHGAFRYGVQFTAG